jgi:hypothetical protein
MRKTILSSDNSKKGKELIGTFLAAIEPLVEGFLR